MNELELINDVVSKYISDCNIEDMNDFRFLTSLIDIFDSNYKGNKVRDFKKRVSLKRCLKYAYDFFMSINPDYAAYLEKRLDEGAFIFETGKEKYDNNLSISSIIDGKAKMIVYLQNTINDAYAITHELIHDMTIEREGVDNSATRSVFCEMFSLLGEELLRDYFERTTRPSEYELESKYNLYVISWKNKIILYELHLIETYLNNGYIHATDLAYGDDDLVCGIALDDILDNKDLSFPFEERYVIGYLFACYMLDRVDSNSKNINEFFELNDIINKFKFLNLTNYLELDVVDARTFDLTDESYKKIENAFVKRLKKVR